MKFLCSLSSFLLEYEMKLNFYTEVDNKLNTNARYIWDLELIKGDAKLDNLWNYQLVLDHRYNLDEFHKNEKEGKTRLNCDFFLVRDPIRFIRNTIQHNDEKLLAKFDGINGSTQNKIDAYFTKCFPDLFMNVHTFVGQIWRNDDDIRSYFSSNLWME